MCVYMDTCTVYTVAGTKNTRAICSRFFVDTPETLGQHEFAFRCCGSIGAFGGEIRRRVKSRDGDPSSSDEAGTNVKPGFHSNAIACVACVV